VIPPPRLLGVFGAGFNVEGVVRWSAFLLGRGQHGDDGQADRLHGQGGRPVVRQDGEADVAVAVDVMVDRDGVRRSHKCYLRRVERIFHSKLELDDKVLSLVEGVGGSGHLDLPDPQVVPVHGVTVQLQSRRRICQEAFELFLEPL